MDIPDPCTREDALSSLARKRGHTDGAALFWTIPRKRNLKLLRLLVAYDIMCDYLDNVHERAPDRRNGEQLHLALIDALDVCASPRDYYRHHPHKNDGGYLQALVIACQTGCAAMPSYAQVRSLAMREAGRAQVLALNHNPDPLQRDVQLQEWVAEHGPQTSEASWFELCAAASTWLTVNVLLALSAEADCRDQDVQAAVAAYSPWMGAAGTMLDSYVDQAEDAAEDQHSYFAHYPDPQTASRRLAELIGRSLYETGRLENGSRHTLILACMIAMYLSKDSARTPDMKDTSQSLLEAGGPL
ncbi:MAG TPA: DUF2600 family protein, partial [Solirubrobacteraceae bacterium]